MVKSEKWDPYRNYCYIVYGRTVTTLVFGVLTILLMPCLFWIIRRVENLVEFYLLVRKPIEKPLASEITDIQEKKTAKLLESIISIPQQCQMAVQDGMQIFMQIYMLEIIHLEEIDTVDASTFKLTTLKLTL